jgi:2-polyprenyl-6-methoxyphenol hydroxylase-like FAD-dependent oxidoreductase
VTATCDAQSGPLPQTQFDAVIVGAGPAGAAAAILLAKAGWSVALVEQQCFPRRKVCGECVAASNLPLLASLGVAQAFDAAAGPELREVSWMRGARTVRAALPPAVRSDYRWGRALGRETLDSLLLDRASAVGATVLQPMQVSGIEGEAGAWRVVIQAPGSQRSRTLRASVAILANGSWEPLASATPAPRALRRGADLLAFKAKYSGTSLSKGVLPVFALGGGYGGMVIAEHDLMTLACCVRRDRLRALRREAPGVAAGDVVEAWLLRECAGVRAALRGATRVQAWLAAGPIAPGIRLDDRDGLFRIGNAAAEAHPIIGEGMSMALQSASLLCARLIDARRIATTPSAVWQRAVQRDYTARWNDQFAVRLRLAAIFAFVAMRPALSAPLMGVLTYWPGLLTFAARRAGKVRAIGTNDFGTGTESIEPAHSRTSTAGQLRHP